MMNVQVATQALHHMLYASAMSSAGGETAVNSLPYFTSGEVVKGFGRGSKELGIPTANYPEDVVEHLPGSLANGVYYGWACVGGGEVHQMVMSIGWNPHFENEKRSMETHILHEFPDDFYGSSLSVCVAGYIRPQSKFLSLDELIAAIKSDIAVAKENLEGPEMKELSRKLAEMFRTK